MPPHARVYSFSYTPSMQPTLFKILKRGPRLLKVPIKPIISIISKTSWPLFKGRYKYFMPLPPFFKKRGPRGGNSFSYKENLAGAPLIIKTIQSPLFLKKVESEGIAKAVQSVLFLEKWGNS